MPLNSVKFINNNAAVVDTNAPFRPVDYKGSANTPSRVIAGTLTTGDTILIDIAYTDDGSFYRTLTAITTSPFNVTITEPFAAIRVRKQGTAGVATVVGIV